MVKSITMTSRHGTGGKAGQVMSQYTTPQTAITCRMMHCPRASYMCVCLFLFFFVYLFVCLFICLFVCLFVCLCGCHGLFEWRRNSLGAFGILSAILCLMRRHCFTFIFLIWWAYEILDLGRFPAGFLTTIVCDVCDVCDTVLASWILARFLFEDSFEGIGCELCWLFVCYG